jgi:hypothetical protein
MRGLWNKKINWKKPYERNQLLTILTLTIAATTFSATADAVPTTKPPISKPAPTLAETTNLTGTWNVKFTESPTTKTHIMAVKVVQKGMTLTAKGVDQYGDVILNGSISPPNKIMFKRTYQGTQVNPSAQFDGTFALGIAPAPIGAKGKWTAQSFADKSLKPKASSLYGDWEATIFTGPAINK